MKIVFSDNKQLYQTMLQDIKKAKKSIFLESYRFNMDFVGDMFRDELIRKAAQGVEVKLLLDSWGSNSTRAYFRELIEKGAEVRFFRKLQLRLDNFENNHKRDHRKLLVIDDSIGYIGSSNICSESVDWRELNLRLTGNVVKLFSQAFHSNFRIYNKWLFSRKKQSRTLRMGKFELLRDVPSVRRQRVRNKVAYMINKAKKSVWLESPYFMPDRKLRKAFKGAVKRGVDVRILLPMRSDVRIMDILRNTYLGYLHKQNVRIYFDNERICHAKSMIVDGNKFLVGSSNFDYRAFIHQFDIALVGEDKTIAAEIKKHYEKGFKNISEFDYQKWKSRHIFHKLFERGVRPFRKLF